MGQQDNPWQLKKGQIAFPDSPTLTNAESNFVQIKFEKREGLKENVWLLVMEIPIEVTGKEGDELKDLELGLDVDKQIAPEPASTRCRLFWDPVEKLPFIEVSAPIDAFKRNGGSILRPFKQE